MSEHQIIITPIRAFSDNYIWAIEQVAHNKVALVDPGDAKVCINYIEAQNLTLTDILITHGHQDHIGGIDTLVTYCQQKQWPLSIYGPTNEQINTNTPITKVAQDDDIQLNFTHNDELALTRIKVIDLFGHTQGHIGFLLPEALFCGDTLFSAGCGRLLGGKAEQLHQSLQKITSLDEHTKLYCAHEYTQANINFALTIEPENNELINYFNQVKEWRANNIATVPSTLNLEKAINPFLRCHLPHIQHSIEQLSGQKVNSPLSAFTLLRTLKDNT